MDQETQEKINDLEQKISNMERNFSNYIDWINKLWSERPDIAKRLKALE